MTEQEERNEVFKFCLDRGCKKCPLNHVWTKEDGTFDCTTKDGKTECVDISFATEKELNKALSIIKLHNNMKLKEAIENTAPIKDSGERTEFSTGAVRDMHEGKGRMDLLPWYGIIEVAKHCEEGAKKYGERNVDKGIPLHSLLDSGARHLAKVIIGMDDEDHLRAACWNLLWALNQRVTHPELNDMPWSKKEEEND